MKRDIIFSGPIAYVLGYDHFSFFKSDALLDIDGLKEKEFEYYLGGSLFERMNGAFPDQYHLIHAVDLLTKGSSVYEIGKDPRYKNGWVAQARAKGAILNDVFAVVSRKQGGEERLQKYGINAHAFVNIDEEFLRAHSNQVDVAIQYIRNEKEWTLNYLLKNGIEILLPYADPNGGEKKLPRFKSFIGNYRTDLEEKKLFESLDNAVYKEYNTHIDEIVGGE